MVIDHLAKPRIKARGLDEWLPLIREASAFPNVCCKLSGMVTEADWRSWTADDLRPYVQAALECFGPDRLMFRVGLAGPASWSRPTVRSSRRWWSALGADLGAGAGGALRRDRGPVLRAPGLIRVVPA